MLESIDFYAGVHKLICHKPDTVASSVSREKFIPVQMRSETRPYKAVGLSIIRQMAVEKTMLDIVLPLAASVITVLLLLSGDVEQNPGPRDGGKHIYSHACMHFYLLLHELHNLLYSYIFHCPIFLQTLIMTALMTLQY